MAPVIAFVPSASTHERRTRPTGVDLSLAPWLISLSVWRVLCWQEDFLFLFKLWPKISLMLRHRGLRIILRRSVSLIKSLISLRKRKLLILIIMWAFFWSNWSNIRVINVRHISLIAMTFNWSVRYCLNWIPTSIRTNLRRRGRHERVYFHDHRLWKNVLDRDFTCAYMLLDGDYAPLIKLFE